MARKVTTDDIKQFNELYYKFKSYAEVARQTGWSASTVSKYIDKNYIPVLKSEIHRFDPKTELPEFSTDIFDEAFSLGDLCTLSAEEKSEITELWRELAV